MFRKLIFLISFVAVLSAAGTASAELVAWWRFDEGSGTTAMDSSGNGNVGGAIQFNGSNSYVAAPHIPLNSQSFTITMWVNPVLYTNETVVFGQVQTGSTNLSMHYRLWGDGRVRMGFYSNDLDTVAGTVADNNWYHLTFWYDFENQVRRIYVDGVQTAEDAGAPYLGASGETRIGQWNNNQWFQGIIDDVQIYDHPLSQNEIEAVMRGLGGFPYASGANPADGSLLADTWVNMSWRAGDFAVSHDVYFSDNFDDVNDGAAAAFQGNQATTFFVAGFPGFPYPEGLVPGTTYYWRIDEVNDADPNSPWTGPVWSFWVPPKKAYEPVPADGVKVLDADVTLSWTGGFGSKLHTVYFGDDFDTVNNATGGVAQGTTTFAAGTLDSDKTYYWRVDELDPPTTHKGDVWSFRTLPEIAVTDPNLIGWWKFDEGAGTVALDMSGHGNHGELRGDPEWIEGQDGGALDFDGIGDFVFTGKSASDLGIEADKPKSVAAWVYTRSFNSGGIFDVGARSGGQDFCLRTLGGVNDWRTQYWGGANDHDFTLTSQNVWVHFTLVYSGTQSTVYANGASVSSEPRTLNTSTANPFQIACYGWQANYFDGIIDDVRLYNKALTVEEITQIMRGDTTLAGDPSPRNGATADVKVAASLTWLPGDNATGQDVYLGTDRSAVEDADASDATGIYRGRQNGTSYIPPEGLAWGTGPYFWRVDQVNNDGTIGTGRIWSFTVADFLIVDDMEGYTDNDADGEAIWQHWLDGYDVAANGSLTGYETPPYAEQSIVHGDSQSMPLSYNNTGGVTNSEVELKLDSSQGNWTDEGVGELSIWIQGQAASTGSFAEAPAGTFTMTGSGTDIWGNADEFHFAYRTLTGAGSIVARVNSVVDTNVWAKGAVMIRETLEPGSKNAAVAVTPGNGVSFQWRMDPDAGSSNATEGGITAPHWVKLERDIAGNFTASQSTDGTAWQMVGVFENIPMSGAVFIGLAVTSHDAGETTEAVFSNVTTTGNVTGNWMSQDIGIAANAAEPLYVAISNATGAAVVVPHPDPAAANADTWTEWVIPLSTFSDQGINLTNVDKIAIGLGSGSGAASPGGSGVMYIDDIRLYRPRP
ncbi:MAG: LamG-like jellyroll fold domain-containing protein [Planctomycetota bacterium]|jgi:hypothetical protein